MTIANVSQGSARGLPQALKTAQEAIHLPEIQEMLRRLSEYKLGIFMPHMRKPDRSLSPCGMVLACRCIDSRGGVRNGLGRRTGR